MVKAHKMFCVDINVAEFLKGKNGSELVNRLLLEYMDIEDCASMTMEQLKAEKEVNKVNREKAKLIEEIRKDARG